MLMTRKQLSEKYNIHLTDVCTALDNLPFVVKFCAENSQLANHYEEMDALEAIYDYFKSMREEAHKAYERFDHEESRIMNYMEELNEYEYEKAFGN